MRCQNQHADTPSRLIHAPSIRAAFMNKVYGNIHVCHELAMPSHFIKHLERNAKIANARKSAHARAQSSKMEEFQSEDK